MRKNEEPQLSRRQREILEIIFRLGKASVSDIKNQMSEAPTDGAIRRMINILYEKGTVDYFHDGAKKIYTPKLNKASASQKALKHVVETFFSGSAARTMASLIRDSNLDITKKEKQVLLKLIEKSKKKGR